MAKDGKYEISWEVSNTSTKNNIVYNIVVKYPSASEISDLGYNNNDKVGLEFVCRQLNAGAFSNTIVSETFSSIDGQESTITLTIPVGVFNGVDIDVYEYTTNTNAEPITNGREYEDKFNFTISLENDFQSPTVVDTFTVSDFNVVGGKDLNEIPVTITFTHNFSNNGKPVYNQIIGYSIYCKDTIIGSILPKFIKYQESGIYNPQTNTYTFNYYLPGVALENKLKENYELTSETSDTLQFIIVTVKSGMVYSKEKVYFARVNYVRPITIDDMYIKKSDSSDRKIRSDMTYTALNDDGRKLWDDSGDSYTELKLFWHTTKKPNKTHIKVYTYFGELSAKLNIFRLGREWDKDLELNENSENTYGYSYPTYLDRTLFEQEGIIGNPVDPEEQDVGHNTTRYVAFEVTVEDENGEKFSRRSQVIKIQRRPIVRNYYLTDTENGKKPYNYEIGFNFNLYPAVSGGNLENASISWGIDRVTLAEWLGINLDKENKSFGELINMYAKNFWSNILKTYERTRNIVSPVWFDLQLVIKSDYMFGLDDTNTNLSIIYIAPEQTTYSGDTHITYTPRFEYLVDTYDKDFLDWLLSLDHQHKTTIDKDDFAFYENNTVSDKVKNLIKANLYKYGGYDTYMGNWKQGIYYHTGEVVTYKSYYTDYEEHLYKCKGNHLASYYRTPNDTDYWEIVTSKTNFDNIDYSNARELMRRVVDSCYLTFRLRQYEYIPRIAFQKYPCHWECPKCGKEFIVSQTDADDMSTFMVNSYGIYQDNRDVDKNFNLLRSSRKNFKCPNEYCDYRPKNYEISIIPRWLQKLTGLNLGIPKLLGTTNGIPNIDLFDYNNRLDKLLTGAFYSGNNFLASSFSALRLLTSAIFSGEFNKDSISTILNSSSQTNSTINSTNTSGINNFKELFNTTGSYIDQFRNYYKATCNKCGHELYLDIGDWVSYHDEHNIKCPYCFSTDIKSKVTSGGESTPISEIIQSWQNSSSTVDDVDFINFYHRMGTLDLDIMAHYSPSGDVVINSPNPVGDGLLDIVATKFTEEDGYKLNLNWSYSKKSYGKATHFCIIAGFMTDAFDYNYDTNTFDGLDLATDTYVKYICDCKESGTFTDTNISCKYSSDSSNINITSELTIKVNDLSRINNKLLAIQIIPIFADNVTYSSANFTIAGKKRTYAKNDSINTNIYNTDYGVATQNSAYLLCANIKPVEIKLDMLNPAPLGTNIYNITPVIDSNIYSYVGAYHWYGKKNPIFNFQAYNPQDNGHSGAKYWVRGLDVTSTTPSRTYTLNNGNTYDNKDFCYQYLVKSIPSAFSTSTDYNVDDRVIIGDKYYQCLVSPRYKQKVTSSNFSTYFSSENIVKYYDMFTGSMFCYQGTIFAINENSTISLRYSMVQSTVTTAQLSSKTILLSTVNNLVSGTTLSLSANDFLYFRGLIYQVSGTGNYSVFVSGNEYNVGDYVLSNYDGTDIYVCDVAGTYSSIDIGNGWSSSVMSGNAYEYTPYNASINDYVRINNNGSYSYYRCDVATNNVVEISSPAFVDITNSTATFVDGNYYSQNDMVIRNNALYKCTFTSSKKFSQDEVTNEVENWWEEISESDLWGHKTEPFEVGTTDKLYVVMKLNPDSSNISALTSITELKFRLKYSWTQSGTLVYTQYTSSIDLYFYDLNKQITSDSKTIYSDSLVVNNDLYCSKCGRLYRAKFGGNSKDYYYNDTYIYYTNDAEDNPIVYEKCDMVNKDTITFNWTSSQGNAIQSEFNSSYPSNNKCLECGETLSTITSAYDKIDSNINGEFWVIRAIECFNGFYGNHTPTYNNTFRAKEIYYNIYDYVLNGMNSSISIANEHLLSDDTMKYIQPTLPTLISVDAQINDTTSNSDKLISYYKSVLGMS